MRHKLLIEYDGTDFKGWQKQPDQMTVQGEIEKAFATIFQQPIIVHGSGRTDSGVHARNQVAHVDLPSGIITANVLKSINRLLGNRIAIKKMTRTSSDFDSRFDATERMYRYFISEKPIAINRQFITQHHKKLDIDLLNSYAKELIGEFDFTTFSKTNSDVEHYESIVYDAFWKRSKGLVVFEISAIRFLRGMVRAIVGMSLLLEKQRQPSLEFKRILLSKDRSEARFHAPAEGLVLERVSYTSKE